MDLPRVLSHVDLGRSRPGARSLAECNAELVLPAAVRTPPRGRAHAVTELGPAKLPEPDHGQARHEHEHERREDDDHQAERDQGPPRSSHIPASATRRRRERFRSSVTAELAWACDPPPGLLPFAARAELPLLPDEGGESLTVDATGDLRLNEGAEPVKQLSWPRPDRLQAAGWRPIRRLRHRLLGRSEELRRKETRLGRARGARSESDDQRHRRASGRVEGSGLVRAERPPEVSEGTRERILEIARELGWYPNRAARALSVERADACGLVLARPAKTIALEPFFMEFIAGVESELFGEVDCPLDPARAVGRGRDRGVPAMVGRAAGGRRPHGRPAGRRPRVRELVRLGLPAVVIGGPVENGALPAVWHDEAGVVIEAVRYVAALGHTRIARVAGVGEFVHTAQRTEDFSASRRSSGSRPRSSPRTTRPRAAPARRGSSSRRRSRRA